MVLLFVFSSWFVMIWYSVPNFLVFSYTLFLNKCDTFSCFT